MKKEREKDATRHHNRRKPCGKRKKLCQEQLRNKTFADTTGDLAERQEKKQDIVEQIPQLDEMDADSTSPKLTLCATPTNAERHCLTFTNGRKSFNDYEYRIISRISFVHVKQGKWELCGDYNNTVSCAILSTGMYIVIPDSDTPNVVLPDYQYMKATSFRSLSEETDEDITMVDIFNEVSMMYKDLMMLSDQVMVLERTLEENTKSLRSPGYRTYHHRKKRFLTTRDET